MQDEKFLYNPFYFEKLCPVLKANVNNFDTSDFILRIFNNAWPDLDFDERTRHIAFTLSHFLPNDFPTATKILLRTLRSLAEKRFLTEEFPADFITAYILLFGADHIDQSLEFFESISRSINTENAIRNFLKLHPEKTYRKMLEWSMTSNDSLRKISFAILANKKNQHAADFVTLDF